MTRKYQKIFAEQEIDLQVFQSLSTGKFFIIYNLTHFNLILLLGDLLEIGITQPNIRQKILDAINEINKE